GPTRATSATIALLGQDGVPWSFNSDFVVSDKVKYDLILGTPWLREYDPQISWRTLSFRLGDQTFGGSTSRLTDLTRFGAQPTTAQPISNPTRCRR
ncbi:MAG: hypothetical protein BJ554DRAFT_3886, partial [Olpidium bornovanus]